jgi:hypothetical protein
MNRVASLKATDRIARIAELQQGNGRGWFVSKSFIEYVCVEPNSRSNSNMPHRLTARRS